MEIPKTIVRLATELGLPAGKVSFDYEFAGWIADVTIESHILHTWSDRGEFAATIESGGTKIAIPLSEQISLSASIENKYRFVLLVFLRYLKGSITPEKFIEFKSADLVL